MQHSAGKVLDGISLRIPAGATEAGIRRAAELAGLGPGLESFPDGLATVRNASRTFVVEKGGLAEEGSHEELLASGGYDADLHQKQLLAGVFAWFVAPFDIARVAAMVKHVIEAVGAIGGLFLTDVVIYDNITMEGGQ